MLLLVFSIILSQETREGCVKNCAIENNPKCVDYFKEIDSKYNTVIKQLEEGKSDNIVYNKSSDFEIFFECNLISFSCVKTLCDIDEFTDEQYINYTSIIVNLCKEYGYDDKICFTRGFDTETSRSGSGNTDTITISIITFILIVLIPNIVIICAFIVINSLFKKLKKDQINISIV